MSDAELHDIAETVRRRFLQQSVLTFDHPGRTTRVDAVLLEVPGVSARDLREGLLADQEARERLFGGSVTLDRHLLLVAALEDAQFARKFAKQIGGDLRAPRPPTDGASSSRSPPTAARGSRSARCTSPARPPTTGSPCTRAAGWRSTSATTA